MTLAFLLPLSCNISPNVSDNVEPTLSSDALAEKLKLSNTYTQIVDLFLNRRDQLKSKSITVDVAKIRSLEQIAKQAKTEVELEKAFKLCYKTGGSDSWKFFMQTSQLFEQLVREIPALRRATSNDLKDAFQKAAQGELNSTIRTESALEVV